MKKNMFGIFQGQEMRMVRSECSVLHPGASSKCITHHLNGAPYILQLHHAFIQQSISTFHRICIGMFEITLYIHTISQHTWDGQGRTLGGCGRLKSLSPGPYHEKWSTKSIKIGLVPPSLCHKQKGYHVHLGRAHSNKLRSLYTRFEEF